MRYAMVQTQIWRHPKIKALPQDYRHIFLYLLTSPHSNMAGYYYLPLTYASEDTGYPIDTLSKGFTYLIDKGMIGYDWDSKVVLVCDYLQWNKPSGPKQISGVCKVVPEVPANALLERFLACAMKHCPEGRESWARIGYQYRIDTVPIAVNSKQVTVNREEEEEEERMASDLRTLPDELRSNWGKAYQFLFVAPAPPSFVDTFQRFIDDAGITDELIVAVLEKAIETKRRNPLKWTETVLTGLVPYEICTVEQWREFEAQREAEEEADKSKHEPVASAPTTGTDVLARMRAIERGENIVQ